MDGLDGRDGSSRLSRKKTSGLVSKLAESNGFGKERCITGHGGRRHLVRDASRPYSVYRLDPVSCRFKDSDGVLTLPGVY